jgi:hypothetical protein
MGWILVLLLPIGVVIRKSPQTANLGLLIMRCGITLSPMFFTMSILKIRAVESYLTEVLESVGANSV